MNNKDRQILQHILNYCKKIHQTVLRFGPSFAAFADDPDYRDSVGMNLLQIGELAGKLSAEYVRGSSQNWRAIKNMRNMFAHDYGSMDIEKIWETVLEDVPFLQTYCEMELNDKEENQGQN